MKEFTVPATLENLTPVQDFVECEMRENGCPEKEIIRISTAVEELYVNIAHYAYGPEIGHATIRCTVEECPLRVTIAFLDSGIPYDPLKKADPDITLSAGERDIGGLGVFMVKRMVDDIKYEYKDGKNILTIHKQM